MDPERKNLKRILADQWLVALGTLYVPVESLRKGVDTYYDFMNVKWAMGWMISRGNFNLKGLATTRKWNTPFLDVWHALIASADAWWFPALVHGLLHALVVPSTFLLAKQVAPSAPNLLHQGIAALAVTPPLVMMQLGTTSGHVYAALPLIWSATLILEAVRRSTVNNGAPETDEQGPNAPQREVVHKLLFVAGAVLALSPILKPSTLITIPAHFVGVLIITSSVSGTAAVVCGFITAWGVVSVGWAGFVAIVAEGDLLNVQIPRLPIAGPSLLFVLLLILISGAVVWRYPIFCNSFFARLDSLRSVFVASIIAGVFINLKVAGFLRDNPGDYRWYVRTLNEFFERLFHTGDLRSGYLTLDLEAPYFDTSMLLSSTLLTGALLLLPVTLKSRLRAVLNVPIGLTVFACGPLIFNAWATGYARYGSQSIPIVGVAAMGFMAVIANRFVRRFGFAIVTVILVFPHFPVDRVSSEVPRFAQLMYAEPLYGPYVSKDELNQMSDLLPKDSLVLAVGEVNSFLAPQLGRDDLTWWFWRPKPDEVQELKNTTISLVYSPGDTDRLRKYADHGLLYKDCSVLRFENTSFGVCRGEVLSI